jgi:hypothetical protein
LTAGPVRGIPVAATLASGAVLLAVPWMLLAAIAAIATGSTAWSAEGSAQQQGSGPVAGIPAGYLGLYRAAAARYGLDWAVLAGVGKVECDHGRDAEPSCRQMGRVNGAGAGGPMQFLASTWSRYGVDGDQDGRRDRWDPADAIYAAANYLSAAGAPGDYRMALFAYNHASWYVSDVLGWASRYRAAAAYQDTGEAVVAPSLLQSRTSTPVRFIEGSTARLAPGDGHLALVPTEAPPAVQAVIVAGNELQALPYGTAGHPDPRGAESEDCSSTVSFLLYRAGIRPISEIVHDNPLAQDYVRWGAPGPGRWFTIYATTAPTPHVFAVVAGLRIDTSHDGTDLGPNRNQNGPRWRIFDAVPSWAHWSVRHPPGL